MNDETFTAETPDEPKKKSKLGCILGGCLGVAAVMLIGLGVTAFFGYRYVTGQVEKYTADTPNVLPVIEYSDEEMEELQTRLDAVTGENGQMREQVVLTADDINALISKNEDFKEKVYITIADGDVTGEVSIPVDMIPGGKGRFLNGSLTAHVSLDDGSLVVRPVDITVNGQKLPKEILDAFSQENLAKELNKEPKARVTLDEISKLEIVGDQVILTPKGVDASGGEASDAAADAASGASGVEEEIQPEVELETTSP